jgi:hypothetical protein
MYSAIVGDFNAKTGTLNDFIIPDETLLDLFNLYHFVSQMLHWICLPTVQIDFHSE